MLIYTCILWFVINIWRKNKLAFLLLFFGKYIKYILIFIHHSNSPRSNFYTISNQYFITFVNHSFTELICLISRVSTYVLSDSDIFLPQFLSQNNWVVQYFLLCVSEIYSENGCPWILCYSFSRGLTLPGHSLFGLWGPQIDKVDDYFSPLFRFMASSSTMKTSQ